MIRRSLISAALACAAALWASRAGATPHTTRIPRVGGVALYPAGTGFETRGHAFREACVTGTIAYVGAPVAFFDFDHAFADSASHNVVTGSIGANVDIFLASASVSTTVSGMTDTRDYVRTVTFKDEVAGKTAKLTNLSLSPRGQQAAATHDPEYIRLVCGDEVVDEVELGGTLLVSTRFDLSSDEYRRELDTTISWSVFGFGHTEHITEGSDELHKNATVTVDAVQSGGDPSKLDAILAAAPTGTCSLDALADCDAIVDALSVYATGPAGFRAQLGNLSGSGEDAPALAYRTHRYEELGLFDLAPPANVPVIDAAAERAIAGMGDQLTTEQAWQRRAQTMLATLHLRPAQEARVHAALNTAEANVLLLSNGIDACYAAPATCLTEAATRTHAIAAVDVDALEKVKTTYDYCVLAQPQAAIEGTLDALAHATGATLAVPAARTPAACLDLERRLDAAGTIALANAGLTDLSPLRGILGVKSLSVRGNHVTTLAPLAEFGDLEELDASGNALTDIAAVTKMPNLARLDVGFNALTDCYALRGLQKLAEVRLEGNRMADFSPAEQLPALRTLAEVPNDLCKAERSRAVTLGFVTAADAATYAVLDSAPIYVTPFVPASGIATWARCDVAARTY
jgi:hypothetical protein